MSVMRGLSEVAKMKTIYIDSEYKCHLEGGEGLTAVETDSFDGLCEEMIVCFRFVPFGKSWTREDGLVFNGQMITPWKNLDEAEKAQREYEKQLLTEYTEALKTLGVSL